MGSKISSSGRNGPGSWFKFGEKNEQGFYKNTNKNVKGELRHNWCLL